MINFMLSKVKLEKGFVTSRIVFSILTGPVHEISNNVVYATSKASDQPAHKRSLIRAFASRYSTSDKLLIEHHLELLSLNGGYKASLSLHVKMPHCWKSHATAHYYISGAHFGPNCYGDGS